MKRVAVLMCGALLVGQAGCSFFGGSMQHLAVASHPDAEIFIDGVKVGKGSVVQKVKRDQSHVIMAKLDDQTAVAGVGTKLSTAGGLDVIGAILFLIPGIGLLTPGAYSLDTEAVTLPLDRKPVEVKK